MTIGLVFSAASTQSRWSPNRILLGLPTSQVLGSGTLSQGDLLLGSVLGTSSSRHSSRYLLLGSRGVALTSLTGSCLANGHLNGCLLDRGSSSWAKVGFAWTKMIGSPVRLVCSELSVVWTALSRSSPEWLLKKSKVENGHFSVSREWLKPIAAQS